MTDDYLLNLAGLGAFEDIRSPDWTATATGDWQACVPAPIREAWPQLTDEGRIIAYMCARDSAKYDYSAEF